MTRIQRKKEEKADGVKGDGEGLKGIKQEAPHRFNGVPLRRPRGVRDGIEPAATGSTVAGEEEQQEEA